MTTGQLLNSYSASDSSIQVVAFSPTAPILAVGNLNEVVLLDERNLTEINRISNGKPGLVRQIVFNSKGSTLVVAYENKSITLY
ncbi:hypothetical protein, partial [Flavihumibacter cheonanensis]|uniref:WD40 domain-containing protein n=1 Tax=Flavihumibacter cheonanensis TaxID=1442385 RepID=UPI001EF97D76